MSEYRIYIVFRRDLPEMTRAKGEVQAAHAAASLIYDNCFRPGGFERLSAYMMDDPHASWDACVTSAQMKVIMEVDGEDPLLDVKLRAERRNVPWVLIQDQARTVFSEPTITCLAFGPCSKADGNNITRHAKMRA